MGGLGGSPHGKNGIFTILLRAYTAIFGVNQNVNKCFHYTSARFCGIDIALAGTAYSRLDRTILL